MESNYIDIDPTERDLDVYPPTPYSVKNDKSKKYRPTDTNSASNILFPVNTQDELEKIHQNFFALIKDYQNDYVKHLQYEKRKLNARDAIWNYISRISHMEDLPNDYMKNLRAEIDTYMSQIFYDNYYNNYQFQKYLDSLFYFYDPKNREYQENLAKRTNDLELEADKYRIGGVKTRKTTRTRRYKKNKHRKTRR
jgi:hypothetical protein